MDNLRKAALLTRLIERLREKGSWCGETHVQKAVYFAQAVAGVDMGYEFVLYRHGPFSFDLRSDLAGLRADGMTELEIEYPYGPRIVTTDQAGYIQGFYSRTLEKTQKEIDFVVDRIGDKGVVDLERLGTGFFLSRSNALKDASEEKIAQRVHDLKRHISPREAMLSLREARKIADDASKLFPS